MREDNNAQITVSLKLVKLIKVLRNIATDQYVT